MRAMEPLSFNLVLGLAAVLLVVQCIVLWIAIGWIKRLRADLQRTGELVVDEVRSITQLMAARIATESMPPVGRAATGPRELPLESQTPASRRFATAPKSVVKAAVEFSNSAFDAFSKPPPAFADTQALEPGELPAPAPAPALAPAPAPVTAPLRPDPAPTRSPGIAPPVDPARTAVPQRPPASAAPRRATGPDFAQTRPE
jgi:hypothetical protein